jgi:MFS family permease
MLTIIIPKGVLEEPTRGAPETMVIRTILRSFAHRNFRLFFSGQTLSLIGTQIQIVALPWFVLRLTGSPLWLGIVSFAAQFPAVFSTPIAGVLADRKSKRNLLLVTQSLAMVQALTLAVLTLSDRIELWHIIVLSVGLSLVNGFDYPARQALLKEMVDDRKDLGNAIALNSVIFNTTRLIGPAVAGFMIVHLGEGVCFLANATSFSAVILALLGMRLPKVTGPTADESTWHGLFEGWKYAAQSPAILSVLYLVALICFLAIPYAVILPVLVRDNFGADPRINGLFYSASGLGALTAGLFLAARPQPTKRLIQLARWPLLAATALVGLAVFQSIGLTLPVVFLLGFAVVMLLTRCNMTLQSIVDDRFRARIMSLYAMFFLGITPLGSVMIGTSVEQLGLKPTLWLLAVGMFAGTIVFASLRVVFQWGVLERNRAPQLDHLA